MTKEELNEILAYEKQLYYKSLKIMGGVIPVEIRERYSV